MISLEVVALSIVAVVAAITTSFMYAYGQGSNFDKLIDEAGANRLQQDLDNEQAFMDCLENGTSANECWAWVLEDCTRLLTIEECEAIEADQ